MTTVFKNENSTNMYLTALNTILQEGDEYSPRGKKVKEIRPVTFEFNPKDRVTFLKGRNINPFFQLAESLWIIMGRSDVEWLTDYNKAIGQFSDNEEFFNAPYGERLRFWNKNDAHGFIYNPIDQLFDVYNKITEDTDTRQAVAVLYNPLFDNGEYTIKEKGKDIPCNMICTFKVRKNKLDLHVFNRSNDLHWGTFGANLCQFSTLLELMASWLRLEPGTYYHTTDSLHIYLDDYGSKITEDVLKHYQEGQKDIPSTQFVFLDEPRISCTLDECNAFLNDFNRIDYCINYKDLYLESSLDVAVSSFDNLLRDITDPYFRLIVNAMIMYKAHKCKNEELLYHMLQVMPLCSWKVSCMRFLSKNHSETINKALESQEGFTEGMKSYILRKDS